MSFICGGHGAFLNTSLKIKFWNIALAHNCITVLSSKKKWRDLLEFISGIMTYDGLESYIQNFQSYSNTFASGCLDEEETNCSSSKYAFGSFFSNWTSKRDNEEADEWGSPGSPKDFGSRKKPAYTTKFSDVEAMKEKFAKLLLGEDVSGGRNGIGSALAISNAITNLAGMYTVCLHGISIKRSSSFMFPCPPFSLMNCETDCEVNLYSNHFRRVVEIGTVARRNEDEVEKRDGLVGLTYKLYGCVGSCKAKWHQWADL